MINIMLISIRTVLSSLLATSLYTCVKYQTAVVHQIFRHHFVGYSWVVFLVNQLRLHPNLFLSVCAVLMTVILTVIATSPTRPVSLRYQVIMLNAWFISPLAGLCIIAHLTVLHVKWWRVRTPLTWTQDRQTEIVLTMRREADSEPILPPVELPQPLVPVNVGAPVVIPHVTVVDDEEPEWMPEPSEDGLESGDDAESNDDTNSVSDDDISIISDIESVISIDSVEPVDAVVPVLTRPRDVDEELPVNFVPNRHYIGWLMGEVKVQFGCPTMSEANRLMVRRWVRDKMRERKMRVTHQRQWLDIVTNSVFLPSDEDIMAREMLMSRSARKLITRYTSPLYTWWGQCIPEPFSRD